MGVITRWKAKLAVYKVLLRVARADLADHPTPRNVARVNLRKAEIARAERVLARHHAHPVPVTTVPAQAAPFITKWEGFTTFAYDDRTGKLWAATKTHVGVKTIGTGLTAAVLNPLPDHITRAENDRIFTQLLRVRYLPTVLRALGPMHPTPGMVTVGLSLVHNLGVGCLLGAPGYETLTRAIKARDELAFGHAILLYDNPGDPAVHAGLKARREDESRLWFASLTR